MMKTLRILWLLVLSLVLGLAVQAQQRFNNLTILSNLTVNGSATITNLTGSLTNVTVDGLSAVGWLTPQMFGAVADGSADDTQSIRDALDAAARAGGGDVLLTAGTYQLSTALPLNVWSGVRLIGKPGAIIRRAQFLTGNTNTGAVTGERYSLYAYTGSSISGITFDGNASATTVSTNGVGTLPTFPWMTADGTVDQTQYGEIGISGGPFWYGPDGNVALTGDGALGKSGIDAIKITDCIFTNAPGSHIKNTESGARSVIIERNVFLNYYDHAVYFAGWPSLTIWPSTNVLNTPAIGVLVNNNSFVYTDAPRANGMFKIRNYANNVLFSGNIVDVSGGETAFAMDVGDSTYGTGPISVSIVNNQIKTDNLFWFSNTTTNETLGHLVFASGNKVEMDGGFGIRKGNNFPNGNLKLLGNFIINTNTSSAVLWQVSGSTNVAAPTVWSVSENSFIGLHSLSVLGNVVLEVRENSVVNTIYPDTFNPSFISFSDASSGRPASTLMRYKVSGNNLFGYSSLISELSDTSAPENLLASGSITLSGNVMSGHPTRNWLTDLRGTTSGSYSGPNRVNVADNSVSSILSTFNTLTNTALNYSGVFKDTITLDGAAATSRQFTLTTSNLNRIGIRLNATAESGSNAGSDLQFISYSDAGSVLLTPLFVKRSTGFIGMYGQTGPQFPLDVLGSALFGYTSSGSILGLRGATGTARQLLFYTGTSPRWGDRVTSTAESGSNVGSDRTVNRYDDSGTISGTPIFFNRASGSITLSDSYATSAHSSAAVEIYSLYKGFLLPRLTNTPSGPTNGLVWYRSDTGNLMVQAANQAVEVATQPTTTTLTWSGTNVTHTANYSLNPATLTLTNNCLLTITSSDGASGGITIVPHASTSYTVYLDSAIKLLGGGSSFVVTNSATETVNLEWKQTKRGASSVILANKAVYP